MLRVPYPANDGGSAVMLATLNALRGAGHDVVVAALNTDKHHSPPEELQRLSPIYTVDIDTSIRWTAALSNVLFSRLPYNVSRFLSEDFSKTLKNLVKAEAYDAILFEGTYTALYAPAVRAQTRAPLFLRAHNVENLIWRRMATAEKNVFKKWFFRHLSGRIKRFEAENLPFFDGVIAITENDEREFRRMGYGGETTVVPATANLERFSFQKPDAGSRKVGFLGSLDWAPNVEGLVWFVEKVWPWVRDRVRGVEFHVAGRNPSPGLAKRLSAPGVVFHGQVDDPVEYLRSFGVTVAPLWSGGGMRVKIVEQMALGKAVVATSVGAEGIDAQNGREIFIADAPVEFAERVLALLADGALVERMGLAAANFAASRFDERGLAGRFESFFARRVGELRRIS